MCPANGFKREYRRIDRLLIGNSPELIDLC